MFEVADNPRLLTALNAGAFTIHVVSASLGTALIRESNPSIGVVAPLFEYNTHPGISLFTPKPKVVFSLGSLTGLVAFAWITAAFHVLYIVQLHSASFRALQARFLGGGGVNPLRWVEFSLTAGIMAACANLNIGATDFYLFLKVLASNVALQMVGFVLELLDHTDPLHRRVAAILWNQATLLNLVNVGILLYQIFASSTHTDVFYYNVVPFAIYFNTFGVISWLSFKRSGPFASPSYTEAWYIALSLSTKTAVFFLGFSTYRGLEEDRGFASRTPGVDWTSVRFVASYLPSSLLIGVATWQYYLTRRKGGCETVERKKGDGFKTKEARLVM